MCDLSLERRRIDAILGWAAIQQPVRDSTDECELAGFGLAVLREYYTDICPDECIRERCKDFAARLARRRKEQALRAASNGDATSNSPGRSRYLGPRDGLKVERRIPLSSTELGIF